MADAERAARLLELVRGDPFGLDALDLHKLLDAWGFARVEVAPVKGWEVTCRYHPEHRDLDVVLQRSGEVPSFVAVRVVGTVDRLRARLGIGA